MAYVDGFVLPVPKKKLAEYTRMARLGARVWMDHGALQYVECVEDDVKPGKLTSFPQSVKLKKGEIVVLAFVVYRSRRHRDAVMKKVEADPRLAIYTDMTKMPFDPKRMFWGGFKPIVQK